MRRASPRLRKGLPELTQRQQKVLALVARGRTNFEIAAELNISLEGAKYHVREIMARLEVDSREEAASVWRSRRRGHRTLGPVPIGWIAAGVGALALAGSAVVAALVIDGNADGSLEAAPNPTVPATVSPTATATDPPPSATPPVFGPYPLGTRTGDPVIDAVLEAVENRDADALLSLIHYAPVPCANPSGSPPAPPHTFTCPNDEPDGTGIPAVLSSNGAVHPEGDPSIPQLVEAFLLLPEPVDPRLYAVVDEDPNLIAGQRGIVFASGEELIVDPVGIVVFLSIATNLPENRVATAESFLLSPLPEDPDAFAAALREELFAAADAAALSDNESSGFEIFGAWEEHGSTVVPGDRVPLGRGQVSAMPREFPPETTGGYTHAVYFAVADNAGTCAAGSVAIALVPDSPRGGFIAFSSVALPPGTPCTADAVASGLRDAVHPTPSP